MILLSRYKALFTRLIFAATLRAQFSPFERCEEGNQLQMFQFVKSYDNITK